MSGDGPLGALQGPTAPLVRAYLDRRGRPAERLPGGAVVAPLGPRIDAPWQMWLASGGADGSWLVVQVRAAHRVRRERWPAALSACNAWNSSSPLTKAWLAVDDWRTAPDGTLVLEASLPAAGGSDQEVVDRFLDTVGREAVMFWRAQLRPAAPGRPLSGADDPTTG